MLAGVGAVSVEWRCVSHNKAKAELTPERAAEPEPPQRIPRLLDWAA
jgi:hypothetical protein